MFNDRGVSIGNTLLSISRLFLSHVFFFAFIQFSFLFSKGIQHCCIPAITINSYIKLVA